MVVLSCISYFKLDIVPTKKKTLAYNFEKEKSMSFSFLCDLLMNSSLGQVGFTVTSHITLQHQSITLLILLLKPVKIYVFPTSVWLYIKQQFIFFIARKKEKERLPVFQELSDGAIHRVVVRRKQGKISGTSPSIRIQQKVLKAFEFMTFYLKLIMKKIVH